MKLIVIGSSSKGNSYALQAESGEILLLEAGVPLKEVKKAIGYKTEKVVGVLVSHIHGDHCKYIKDYIKACLGVYSNIEVADKHFGVKNVPTDNMTFWCGDFYVTPFKVEHDVLNYGYLIHHRECGSLFFSTDCYNLKFAIRGCSTYLAECNYDDSLLNKAISEGKTPASQADRVRLSHMSLEHCVSWLQDCEAEKSAKQIVLIHGSSRHLKPELAVNKVQQVIGIPTWYAKKGLEIELRK